MASPVMTAVAQSSTRRRVLVAEDHGALRELLVMLLRADGYDVVEVANGFDLVDAVVVSSDPELGSGKFDLVISDVRMPGMSGLSAFASMDYFTGLPPVVFITAFADDQVHVQAQKLGAIAVFDKPIDFDELRAFVTHYFASPSSQGAIAK
jgi:two-component system, cell cycle sensor histidine kinase and response regulator CckA